MNREAKGCLDISRKPRALGLQATTRHNGIAVSIDNISKGVTIGAGSIGAGSIRAGREGKNRETNTMAHMCSPGLLQPGSLARAMGEKAKRAANATARAALKAMIAKLSLVME